MGPEKEKRKMKNEKDTKPERKEINTTTKTEHTN